MNTTVDNHQTFDRFKTELKSLVEKFKKNQWEYRQSDYVEARLRDDFLNPLFRALGWDTENNRSLIQMEREVEIESATRVGHARKRADYLFRTHKIDRFVCEAKKPSDSLHRLRGAGKEKLKYVLGIVNSQLMTWFHRQRFLDPNKITFQKILIQDAKLFPIRRIDFKQPLDTSRHNTLVLLVDKMMSLTPKLSDARSDAEKSVLHNAITATDQQIDALVYELYGLSANDIALVEGRI